MRLLFIGDLVGRPGREAFFKYITQIRQRVAPDCLIVNAENAAGGFGINDKIAADLLASHVDVITTGNHAFDQASSKEYYESETRLLRPLNYPPAAPGRGAVVIAIKNGLKVAVINAQARLFMDPLDCPFRLIAQQLQQWRAEKLDLAAIFVDFHGEATSEKMAMAHFLDGQVTAVIGTHTHVPTADAQILSGGTAFQSDAGMSGCYNSVIGMDKSVPITRFISKMPTARMEVASGAGTVCGVCVDVDVSSGLAKSIAPLRVGPLLQEAWPDNIA